MSSRWNSLSGFGKAIYGSEHRSRFSCCIASSFGLVNVIVFDELSRVVAHSEETIETLDSVGRGAWFVLVPGSSKAGSGSLIHVERMICLST